MNRPAIIKIAEEARGDDAEVRIILEFLDEEHEGISLGSPALAARPRLIGEATLRAVESVVGNTIGLKLEGVATQNLGPIQVAMVHITLAGETLVGTALLDSGDPASATVKAVLDALNRRIGNLAG